MLNIDKFKRKDLKYKNLKEYVKSHPNISEETKKKMQYSLEFYQFALLFIDEEEVKKLIDKCISDGSSKPLQKKMHSIGVGSSSDLDENCCLYNRDGGIDDDYEDYR